MTTTFIAENETLPNASYFEGNNNLISGRLYKSLVTINGYVIINNRSTSAIKFKYHFGEIELGKVKANIPIPLDKFASSAWQENIIVAFALVE